MTTIAYRDGVMAADSLTTCNGMRVAYVRKVWKCGRLLVGAAGDGALGRKFLQFVKDGIKDDGPFTGKTEGNGVVITPDNKIVCWGTGGASVYDWPYFALGSGEAIATGALEAGATAEEAVAAAIRVDVHSGGPIISVRLDGPR